MGDIIKYKAQIAVASPVHISGVDYKSNLNRTEYLLNKNTLTIIDTEKFTKVLIQKGIMDKYIKKIYEDLDGKKQHEKRFNLYKFLKDEHLENEIWKFTKKEYKNLSISTKNNRRNDIRLLVKDVNGNPYIPGSSIKGAIENSLIVNYLLEHNANYDKERKEILRLVSKLNKFSNNKDLSKMKKDVSNIIKSIQDDILYYKVENKKNMRNCAKKFGLSISDSYKSENVNLGFLQDVDYSISKDDYNHMPLMREYIMPDSKFWIDMTLDTDIMQKSKLKIKDIDQVIDAIENSSKYLTENLLDMSEECLIIGGNTGFHQKTVLYALFKNPEQRQKVVSRILHSGTRNPKLKMIKEHINDRVSPRVINFVNLGEDGYDIAGLVALKILGDINVGKYKNEN